MSTTTAWTSLPETAISFSPVTMAVCSDPPTAEHLDGPERSVAHQTTLPDGQSATNAGVIYAGAQDNGTDRLANGNWTQVFGADGMDCMVDYTDDDIAYVSYQYGALQRSTDGGNNFNDIAPSSGEWVTPFAIDPVDHNTIYAGYDQVLQVNQPGHQLEYHWPAAIGGGIIALAIAPSNPITSIPQRSTVST